MTCYVEARRRSNSVLRSHPDLSQRRPVALCRAAHSFLYSRTKCECSMRRLQLKQPVGSTHIGVESVRQRAVSEGREMQNGEIRTARNPEGRAKSRRAPNPEGRESRTAMSSIWFAVSAVWNSAPVGIPRPLGFGALRDSAPFGFRRSGFGALWNSALVGTPSAPARGAYGIPADACTGPVIHCCAGSLRCRG